MGLEAAFDGAVGTVLGGIDCQCRQEEILSQLLPELFAQVGHVSKGVGMFLPEPFPYLLSAEFLLSHSEEESLQVGVRQGPDVFCAFGYGSRF